LLQTSFPESLHVLKDVYFGFRIETVLLSNVADTSGVAVGELDFKQRLSIALGAAKGVI
jgi:hypothetical protein